MRILIASEDASLTAVLNRLLQDPCLIIESAASNAASVAALVEDQPDLLVLDLHKEGGLQLLRAVREAAPVCPVLALSERASPALRSMWMENGADDCIGRPFSLIELRARCRALLRRQQAIQCVVGAPRQAPAADALQAARTAEATLELDGLELDRVRRLVAWEGSTVRLTDRQTLLLGELMREGGTVVSREILRDALAEPSGGPAKAPATTANVVDVHISAVRRKLQQCAATTRIETVRGAGYRMVSRQLAALPHVAFSSQPGARTALAGRGPGR